MTPDQLQRHLRGLPEKVEDELAKVLPEQAKQLSDAQRAALLALEAPPSETGHLEQSCRVEINPNNPLDVRVKAGGELTTTEVRKGSGKPYDHALGFVYGTSRQPARDFFWSTYRARKDQIRNAIKQAIKKALDNDH